MILVDRASGILLHPTSLPGGYGVGDFGHSSFHWIDCLVASKQKLWQILPLGPTGYGNSPYQSLSSFAGNSLLISLEKLFQEGFLDQSDFSDKTEFQDAVVDYDKLLPAKDKLLEIACENFIEKLEGNADLKKEFERFCEKQSYWLEDYAIFLVLKKHHNGKAWMEWESCYALREDEAMKIFSQDHDEEIMGQKVIQYFFEYQWLDVLNYARSSGISIIGDLPIFVAQDSADVWANRELFDLNSEGYPNFVAGVPPDYFSDTGQRWGNPLYNWEVHQNMNYDWWCKRIERSVEWCDYLRIDHFRGFAGYWSIPAGDDTAVNGEWLTGPGARFFQSIEEQLGELPIIAEDLGIITDDVKQLRDEFNLPGMRVIQFAFGGDVLAEEYLPENYPANSVAYTGTHDNDTTMGFWSSKEGESTTRSQEEIDRERDKILQYLGKDGGELNWNFIEVIQGSEAMFAIQPLQDVLGLGSESRMNVPGTTANNWRWRFSWDQLKESDLQKLAHITLVNRR